MAAKPKCSLGVGGSNSQRQFPSLLYRGICQTCHFLGLNVFGLVRTCSVSDTCVVAIISSISSAAIFGCGLHWPLMHVPLAILTPSFLSIIIITSSLLMHSHLPKDSGCQSWESGSVTKEPTLSGNLVAWSVLFLSACSYRQLMCHLGPRLRDFHWAYGGLLGSRETAS